MKIPTILEYPDVSTSACSYWRARGVLAELVKQGKINLVPATWQEDWSTIRLCDIAFFQRPMSEKCIQQVMMCKDLGLKIWIDLDDFNEIPPYHEVFSLYTQEYNEKTFQKIMLMADVVTVSTEYLKQHYLKYAMNVVVIPNAINDFWLPMNKQSNKKLIFYRGGGHHLTDLWEYKDEIIEVMSGHSDWLLCTIGCDPKFINEHVKEYQALGDFSIHDYFGLIIQSKPSVFIVPLLDNNLNRGKSNISFQEATMAGAVSLTPSYWSLKGCSMQYGSKKTFLSGFNKLLDNAELRESLFKKSRAKIKDEYVLSKVNEKRINVINNLLK
jgi:hypothetical protein